MYDDLKKQVASSRRTGDLIERFERDEARARRGEQKITRYIQLVRDTDPDMNRLLDEMGVLERDIERRRASGLPVGEPTKRMAIVQGEFDRMIATRNAAVADFGNDDGDSLADQLASLGRSVQRALHEVGFILLYMVASVVGVLMVLALIVWIL